MPLSVMTPRSSSVVYGLSVEQWSQKNNPFSFLFFFLPESWFEAKVRYLKWSLSGTFKYYYFKSYKKYNSVPWCCMAQYYAAKLNTTDPIIIIYSD